LRQTRTFNVDLRRLERTGQTGVLVIRLMRAANDLAIANAGYRRYSNPGPPLEEHIRPGARRYFVRLQCGHLSEAIRLVGDVRKNAELAALVPKCSADGQAAFAQLSGCLTGGPHAADFDKYVRRVRNKVAFHYDAGSIESALAERAAHPDMRIATVTLGTQIDLWRFAVADDIEASVVVRQLWEVPEGADLAREDDRISGFASALCRDFIQFAGELSTLFLRERAQI